MTTMRNFQNPYNPIGKCCDCGKERSLRYDTRQCAECEQAEHDSEQDAIDRAEE